MISLLFVNYFLLLYLTLAATRSTSRQRQWQQELAWPQSARTRTKKKKKRMLWCTSFQSSRRSWLRKRMLRRIKGRYQEYWDWNPKGALVVSVGMFGDTLIGSGFHLKSVSPKATLKVDEVSWGLVDGRPYAQCKVGALNISVIKKYMHWDWKREDCEWWEYD